MRFNLNHSCFHQGPNTGSLVLMSQFALKGRHRLYVNEPSQRGYKQWVSSLPTELADEWNLAIDYSVELEAMEPASRVVTVCEETPASLAKDDLIINVESAERMVREPFRVFVENDDADRDFLLTFSNRHQAKKIAELERELLLSFEHCGGIGELKKKVRKYAEREALNSLNCSAVFDSDAPGPGMMSADAIAAQATCDTFELPAFMLKRRAIENYLMRSWLKGWASSLSGKRRREKLKLVDAFSKLSLEQRSHFHMKKGLKADQIRIQSKEFSLYDGVPAQDLTLLNDGFGDGLAASLYATDWVKDVQAVEDTDAWKEVNDMVNDILVLCR